MIDMSLGYFFTISFLSGFLVMEESDGGVVGEIRELGCSACNGIG